MLKTLKNISIASALTIFLIVFYSAEAVNKIALYYVGHEIILQKAVKLMAFAFIILWFLLHQAHQLIKLGIIAGCFVMGQLALENSFTPSAIISFSKYFFFLGLILFTIKVEATQQESLLLKRVFETIIIINSVLIILGFCLQLSLFQSYPGGRFGYNALFMASSNSTYFYLLTYMYYIGVYRKKLMFQFGWWIALVAGCLIGTKSIYLSLLLFLFGMVMAFSKNKKFKLSVGVAILVIGIAGTIIFFSSDLFSSIVKKDGIVTAILSYRDAYLVHKTLPYVHNNWSTLNYLFGGGSNPAIRPQLEYIDLLLYLGVVGAFFFLYYFYRAYFTFVIQEKLFIYCFLVLLAVTCIAGNFFYNGSVPIYLVILKYLYVTKNKLSKSEEYP